MSDGIYRQDKGEEGTTDESSETQTLQSPGRDGRDATWLELGRHCQTSFADGQIL